MRSTDQRWQTVQFSSVAQLCPTLCDPVDCSMPGFPVHHQLLELAQTHVHWVGDAIQTSHPLSSPSPPAFNLSQHQGLFQWASSLHQVAKVLEFQLQHQSFQWEGVNGARARMEEHQGSKEGILYEHEGIFFYTKNFFSCPYKALRLSSRPIYSIYLLSLIRL